MVLSVSISAEAEVKLKAKASTAGVGIATYAAEQLELLVAQPRSLRDISGLIGQSFSQSSTSEDQLSELLEVEKHAMHAEAHSVMVAIQHDTVLPKD